MVCRRSLLKKCRGVDIRAAHSPRVASAVDSRSDTRAGKQAGNRTADTPGAGGWPSAKMPAAPKERQQWAVRGAAHRPEAVPPAASCALSPEEPLGAVMVINLSRQRCSPFGGPRSLAG